MSSVIELSPAFAAGLPARVIQFGAIQSNDNLVGLTALLEAGTLAYGYSTGRVTLMQGTVPSDFSTLTDYSVRSADVLCEWSAAAGQLLVQQNVNPAVLSSAYANATQSGTATWMWITTRPAYQPDNGNTLYHQIIATVGVTGSGADLEIATTTVISGAPYRFLNLRINFPSNWSY